MAFIRCRRHVWNRARSLLLAARAAFQKSALYLVVLLAPSQLFAAGANFAGQNINMANLSPNDTVIAGAFTGNQVTCATCWKYLGKTVHNGKDYYDFLSIGNNYHGFYLEGVYDPAGGGSWFWTEYNSIAATTVVGQYSGFAGIGPLLGSNAFRNAHCISTGWIVQTKPAGHASPCDLVQKPDADDDGIADEDDAYPNDDTRWQPPNGATANPNCSGVCASGLNKKYDCDCDGIPNGQDTDDDNDGCANEDDPDPLDNTQSCDGRPDDEKSDDEKCPNGTPKSQDCDCDRLLNDYGDDDDDNDGCKDVDDPAPCDPDVQCGNGEEGPCPGTDSWKQLKEQVMARFAFFDLALSTEEQNLSTRLRFRLPGRNHDVYIETIPTEGEMATALNAFRICCVAALKMWASIIFGMSVFKCFDVI